MEPIHEFRLYSGTGRNTAEAVVAVDWLALFRRGHLDSPLARDGR